MISTVPSCPILSMVSVWLLLPIFITRVGLPPVVCQACARHFVRWMRMCCYWEVTIGGVTGGDVTQLFQALKTVETPCGTYAVMGNHERGQADSLARKAMQETGVHLLEHKVDTLWRGKEYILLCGIRNPFDLKQNGVSPTLALQEEDFVLMLVHTPDYVEDVNVAHTDLALAGHTHGGTSQFVPPMDAGTFFQIRQPFPDGVEV